MTRHQYERDIQLQRLSQGILGANPRYVQNAVDFTWERILDRKLRRDREFLRSVDCKRLDTFAGLYARMKKTQQECGRSELRIAGSKSVAV